MQKMRVVLSVSATLPLLLSAAFAQAQSVAPATYELKGTTISGAAKKSAAILTAEVDPDSAPIKTESGLYLYPSVFTGYGYNSNINNSGTVSRSSNFLNVAPQLIAEMKNDGDRYTALVSVDSLSYQSSSADNVTNSEISIAGDNYFDARTRMGWQASTVGGNDAAGSNQRNLNSPTPWRTNGLNGTFIYGAAGAQGRFELDLGVVGKTYDNNPLGEFSANNIGGRGFYRLGNRSSALVEIAQLKTSYKDAASTDSNTSRKYYAGITWDASAATTGIFKIGRQTKDFDSASKEAFGGSSWEATARWTPLTYSVVNLQTSKSAFDATGVGSYEVRTNTSINWRHKWTQTVATTATVGTLVTDFGGPTALGRSDTANSYSIGFDYSLRRWLKLGLDFTSTDNASNKTGFSYKRNVAMFTLNASL